MQEDFATQLTGVEPLKVNVGSIAFALDQLNEALVWVNLQGNIQWCNAAFARLIDRTKAAVIHCSIMDCFPLSLPSGESVKPLVEMAIASRKSGAVTGEFDRQGQRLSLTMSWSFPDAAQRTAFSIPEEGLLLVIGRPPAASIPSTQREMHIQALVQSRADVVFVAQVNGRCNYVGPSIQMVLGKSVDACLNQDVFEDVHANDLPFVRSRFQTLIETSEQIVHLEVRVRHVEGHWLSVDCTLMNQLNDPLVQGIVVHFRDITDRKRAEEKLRQQQELLRTVIDTNPNLIFIKDWDGRYVLANQAMAEFHGFAIEDCIGKTPLELGVSPENTASYVQQNRWVISTRRPFFVAEELYGDSRYEDQWLQWHKRPIFLPDSETYAVLGVGVNITDRKRAETALQSILQGTASVTGAAFFSMLVQTLASALGVRYAMIAELVDDRLSSLAFCLDDQLQPNFVSTPQAYPYCELALQQGKYCCPEGLQQQFPDVPLLRSLQLESYLGVACYDANGVAIGVLGIADDRPLTGIQRAEMILQIFAARAGAELERQRAIQALQQLNQELEARVTQRTQELWQSQIALRESEEQFRRIFEDSPIAIGLMNLDDYRLIKCNAAFRGMLDYGDKDLTTLTLAELSHPNEWQTDFQWIRQLLDGTIPCFSFEKRFVKKGGEIIWTNLTATLIRDPQGRPLYALGMIQDITRRKLAEFALQESEEKFRQLAESIQEIFWLQNIEGEFLYISPSYERIWGLSAAAVYDDPWDWTTLIHPDDYDRVMAAIRNQYNAPVDEVYRIVRLDGEIRWVHDRSFPVRDQQGHVYRLAGITEDITVQKQAEAQLRQLNDRLAIVNMELARANRLKDEFLTNMSHELRTPLNSILGLSEVLFTQVFGALNEKQQQFLSTIRSSGRHLLELINDILDLAKIEAGQLELNRTTVVIQTLCEASLAFVEQQAVEKQIKLQLELSNAIQTIEVDERRIRQVLINLLSNAVKFTPEGGQVCLRVCPVEAPCLPEANPGERSPGAWVQLSVIDTGIGIAPEDLGKLFKTFVQLDSCLSRQYEGTGLGLVLVKQLVDVHGGQVRMESRLGEGSCFHVLLPCSEVAPGSANGLEPADAVSLSAPTMDGCTREAATAPVSRPRLSDEAAQPLGLLIGELEDVASLVNSLKAQSFQLMITPFDRMVVNRAKAVQPQFIVMDFNGFDRTITELLYQLRADPTMAFVPIVILAASNDSDERERCLTAGADQYITKPVNSMHLVILIRDLLRRRLS